MTNSTALARAPHGMALGSLADPETLGRLLAASHYFEDARDAAQAVVKVLAGAELGFGPIASMTGVYIVKGRVTLSANLMAATVKRHPKYDYRVKAHTNERAEIEFFEGGKSVGSSEFTADDAKRAGLAGENWRKYPANMLFWRAMSNGCKFFAPDAFAGAPIYTPDELGAEVDGATGDFITEQAAVIDDAVTRLAAQTETPPHYELRGDAGTPAPSVEGGIGMPPVPAPQPEPEPTPAPQPEPAPEPEPAPAMLLDRDAPLSDEDADNLVTELHRTGVQESFWRMGVMRYGVDSVRALNKGQAHDLLLEAKRLAFGPRAEG